MTTCIYCDREFTPYPARRKVCPSCIVRRKPKPATKAKLKTKPKPKPAAKARTFPPPSPAVAAAVAALHAARNKFDQASRLIHSQAWSVERMDELSEVEIQYRLDKASALTGLAGTQKKGALNRYWYDRDHGIRGGVTPPAVKPLCKVIPFRRMPLKRPEKPFNPFFPPRAA